MGGRAAVTSSQAPAAAGSAGHPPRPGLARMPTYARLDRQASRPKTLSTFDHVNDLELNQDEKEALHDDQPQSARAALRSWSLTGGTRDASFKKRPKVPSAAVNVLGDAGNVTPTATAPAAPKQRAVGFATVLSMSGWSEIDAEEVEFNDVAGAGKPPAAAASAALAGLPEEGSLAPDLATDHEPPQRKVSQRLSSAKPPQEDNGGAPSSDEDEEHRAHGGSDETFKRRQKPPSDA